MNLQSCYFSLEQTYFNRYQYRRIPKVIFQLHGLPPFCFPPSWFFSLTNTIEGRCYRPSAKMFLLFQSQKNARPLWEHGLGK